MTDTLKTDICIIGGGSAGLSLAAGAVQMGASVVLIEAGEMGGDCLNTGCVPSKALLAAGRDGASYAQAMARVRQAITTIAPHDSQERYEGLGCTVIRDWARFTGPRQIEVAGKRIAARRFVIAAGSVPSVPPIPGLDQVPYLTTDTLWEVQEQPGHLLILGGGPIGMEMAQAHRRLGAEVTVIEADTVLAREEPEMAAALAEALRAEGIALHEGAKATGVSGGAGAITVQTEAGAFTGTHLLVATGRRAALERLDLPAAGVKTTRAGVETDAGFRSVSNRHVYAIGDAAGQGQFTHLAAYQAGIALRRIVLGLPARGRLDHIPRAVYTEPELAAIGLSEAEARHKYGGALEVITQSFAGNDRAIAEGRIEGSLKLMVARGRPVGVAILADGAGEMIAPWALAFSARLKLSAMAGAVFAYPTRAELAKRTAGAYFGPRLFDSPWVKRAVRAVQRLMP